MEQHVSSDGPQPPDIRMAVDADAPHDGASVLRRQPSPLFLPSLNARLVRAAAAAVGAALGASILLPTPADEELMLALLVFTFAVSVIATVLCRARTDLYLSFHIPLIGLTTFSLIAHDRYRWTTIAILVLVSVVTTAVIHHVVRHSALQLLASAARTQRLVDGLAAQHLLLSTARASAAELNRSLGLHLTHDPLSGLLNRQGAIASLESALDVASSEAPVGLLYLDLDRFKFVNDTVGHRGGDQFISVIADRLVRSLDVNATAGRIGGDEFIVVLPDSDLVESMAVATRIASVMSQPVHARGRELPSSVSIGVVVGPHHGIEASELLGLAHATLRRAKESGRERVEAFDGSVRAELDARVHDQQALRRALDEGDIVALYQPEVDATTGQLVGASLLARWMRRDGSVVPRSELFRLATHAGLLERITDHIMQQARPVIRRLDTLGLPDGFRFRLNLPPTATERRWRDNPLDPVLHGIEPSLITVNVTESAVIQDLASAAANLAALRVRGVRVCLDHFAQGVSSLRLLRMLPLDEVRIDRSSIDAISAHPHDRAIVRSIIALVRELGLTVTSDGVENGAQADALIALGCIRHQGLYYSASLPASEFDSYVATSMVQRYTQETQTIDVDNNLGLPPWPTDGPQGAT